MKYSVVIPVFNEEDSVFPLSQSLKKVMDSLNEDYEIIFVDDASEDNTSQALEKICSNNKNIQTIRLSGHYGKETALYTAFKAVKSNVIVTIDGDLQNLPEDIPLLLKKLEQCDAVIGWRRKRHDSLGKRISSCIANLFRNKVLCENFHDAGCGLRAFKRECLMDVIEYKMCDLFLMSIMRNKGYKIEEIPIRHAFRKFGKSKFSIKNRLFKNTLALFRARKIIKNYKKMHRGNLL